jgi:ribosomal protein S18 acetylase RimI-like enzyme
MLRRVLVLMAKDRARGLVCVVGGAIVGYGQLTRWPHSAEISDLIIKAEYQGRGLGTALIRRCIALARAWGSTQIEIGSTCANTGAIRLYERLGFRPDRQLHLDVGNGLEPVVYLVQPLPAPAH